MVGLMVSLADLLQARNIKDHLDPEEFKRIVAEGVREYVRGNSRETRTLTSREIGSAIVKYVGFQASQRYSVPSSNSFLRDINSMRIGQATNVVAKAVSTRSEPVYIYPNGLRNVLIFFEDEQGLVKGIMARSKRSFGRGRYCIM